MTLLLLCKQEMETTQRWNHITIFMDGSQVLMAILLLRFLTTVWLLPIYDELSVGTSREKFDRLCTTINVQVFPLEHILLVECVIDTILSDEIFM